MSSTFIAAYDGKPCGTCDERIKEGDEVCYDGTNRLVHAVCPVIEVRAPRPICQRCFLELPLSGICGSC